MVFTSVVKAVHIITTPTTSKTMSTIVRDFYFTCHKALQKLYHVPFNSTNIFTGQIVNKGVVVAAEGDTNMSQR